MPHCWKYRVAAQIYFNRYRGKKRLEKSLETAKNDMTSLQEKLLNLQTGECVHLSHDVASGSDIMPCIKINKPLMIYRFHNVM